MSNAPAPRIHGVVETILYVEDLPRAIAFYTEVLGLSPMTGNPERFQSFDAGQARVLLLFKRGATLETLVTPGGNIPPHDGHGPLHIAYGIGALQPAVLAWRSMRAVHCTCEAWCGRSSGTVVTAFWLQCGSARSLGCESAQSTRGTFA